MDSCDICSSAYPQKFGHWHWHPEFPRRLGGEPAAARFRGVDVDGLLVRTPALQHLTGTRNVSAAAANSLPRSPARYGQLSGMVEPAAGLLGAFAVVLAEPLLPYALAFAAGAMVYVVVDDIIPEAQVR